MAWLIGQLLHGCSRNRSRNDAANLASHIGEDTADRFAAAYITAGGDPAARDPFWIFSMRLSTSPAADSLLDLESATVGSGDFARFERYVEDLVAQHRFANTF